MRDHSHRFLFLGLTGVMSAVALWGSEAGPTLMVGKDATPQAINAGFTPRVERDALTAVERDALTATAPSKAPIAAKLAPDASCSAAASEASPLCRATSKVSLSSP